MTMLYRAFCARKPAWFCTTTWSLSTADHEYEQSWTCDHIMKLITESTTLVIAGAWNPAILTPEWILKHGLQKELSSTNKVQAFVPVGPSFRSFGNDPKFVLDELAFIAQRDAFILFPRNIQQENLALVESVAKKTLDCLAHTPITGIGHNFEFQDDAPVGDMLEPFSVAQVDIVDIAPDGFLMSSNAIETNLNHEQVFINIRRHYDGSRFRVTFNFHYEVASAMQAAEVLFENDMCGRFYKNYQLATDIVKKLYGENYDENDQ